MEIRVPGRKNDCWCIRDAEVTTRSGPDLNNTVRAQQLPNTGGLAGTTGQLFDVMNLT